MATRFAQSIPATKKAILGLWAQSNGTPTGSRMDATTLEDYADCPHLELPEAGHDITIAAISGSNVDVSAGSLTASAEIGKEIRLIRPIYGQAICPARAGCGIVTANTTSALTVTWQVTPPTLPTTATTHSFDASNTITLASHDLIDGDHVIFTGDRPPEITEGAVYIVRDATANTFKLSASLGGAVVAFTATGVPTAGTMTPTVAGYVYWADGRGMSYSNVKVLQPYIPDDADVTYPTGAPVVPGVTFPASIEDYEHAALFLPFTFHEGVDGYGVSNSGGTVTYSTASGKARITDTSLALATNILYGATFQFGAGESEILTVESNTATTITFTTDWTDAAPAAGTEYEGSVHHYRDNPNGWTRGWGFRYSSGWTCQIGAVYCRPRGRLTSTHVPASTIFAPIIPAMAGLVGEATIPIYFVGHMLTVPWRLSALLQRDIYVVGLAMSSASLYRSGAYCTPATPTGWFNRSVLLDWMPEGGNNAASRYKAMWDTMAAGALSAEGATGFCLGVVGFQGESDALSTATGLGLYPANLAGMVGWQRRLIAGAGYNAFVVPDDIPVVHAEIGSYWTNYVTFNGYVSDWAAKDAAGDAIDVADAEQTGGHFTTAGVVSTAELVGDAMVALLNTAAQSMSDDATALAISRQALQNLGDKGTITSLDPTVDGSTQAKVCAEHYRKALDILLETHAWNFAVKKEALVAVTNTNDAWTYAYALPADLADALQVLPDGAAQADVMPPTPGTRWLSFDGEAAQMTQDPIAFSIETDADGYEVLFCNVQDAWLRYTKKINGTVRLPSQFRVAVAWRLSALIAPKIIKGDDGRAAGQRAEQMAEYWFERAAAADSNQRKIDPPHMAPWDAGR